MPIRCDACGGSRRCVCPDPNIPAAPGGIAVTTRAGERGTVEPGGGIVRTDDGRVLRVRLWIRDTENGDLVAWHTGNLRAWRPINCADAVGF